MNKGVFNKFFAVSLSWAIFMHPIIAYANPQNGNIVAGNITISNSGNTTTIQQSSQKGVIDWQSFSIDAGEHTQFNQPNASAITLNRVTGGNASNILGSLSANGNVWIINPQGIVFGAGSRVDVGSLLATTNNITNQDFISENYSFIKSIDSGFINNQGIISIKDAGYAALVAPIVHNSGVIQVKLGKIALAGGEAFTFDMYGDNLIKFAVSSDSSLHVENSGILKADGGNILLTTQDVTNLLGSVIDTTGLIEANTLEKLNGKIVLSAGTKGTVIVEGTINTKGNNANTIGGEIDIVADAINIIGNSQIDASGISGGGQIRIGGDYQGQGKLKTANYLNITENVSIKANAIENGNGGRIINWANDTTWFNGKIEAKGGANSGNGGFVEVSGKKNLYYRGLADLTAANGQMGDLLLDPENITISSLVFDPTDIANLVFWLDAEQGVTGDPVSAWADQETGLGGANNLSQGSIGSRPDLVTAGLNGRDVIAFDGVNDMLDQVNNVSINTGNSAERSQVVSFKTGADVTSGQIIYEEGGGTNGTSFYIESGNLYVGAWSLSNGAGTHYFAGAVQPNTVYTSTMVWDFGGTNTATGYLNGALLGSAPVTGFISAHSGGIAWGNDDNTRTFSGSTVTGGKQFLGQLGESVLYNTALSDVERQNLDQYMSLKWSPTLSAAGKNYTFSLETLEAQLAAANLILMAEDNITIDDIADDSLDLAMTSLGSINFIADNDGDGVGTISMDASDKIETQGGNVSMSAATIAIASIVSNGGDINLSATDGVTFSNLNAGAGNIAVTVDSNNDTVGSILTAGAITANGITLTGGTDNDDVANLNSLTTVNSGGLSLVNFPSVNIGANINSTGSNLTFNQAVNITANSQINSNGSDLTFTSTINGANALTLDAGAGNVDLQGDIGGSTILTSLTVNGGSIAIEKVTTSGAQNYTGDITLNGDITTSGGDVVFDDFSTISASRAIVTAGGKISFIGGVDGNFDLNLTAGAGDITFGANSGASNRLKHVTITSAKNVTNNATLKAGKFTQSSGTGTTNLGTTTGMDITNNVNINTVSIQGNIVTAKNVTYKVTGAADGDISVENLTLEAARAELTGSISSNTNKIAADSINLTKTTGATGPFTFNGITFPVVESTVEIEQAITVISSLSSSDFTGGSGSNNSSFFSFIDGNAVRMSGSGRTATTTPGDLASAMQNKKSMIVNDPFNIDFRLITAEKGSESRYRSTNYLFDNFWLYLSSKDKQTSELAPNYDLMSQN